MFNILQTKKQQNIYKKWQIYSKIQNMQTVVCRSNGSSFKGQILRLPKMQIGNPLLAYAVHIPNNRHDHREIQETNCFNIAQKAQE